jgi:hypothetical protein
VFEAVAAPDPVVLPQPEPSIGAPSQDSRTSPFLPRLAGSALGLVAGLSGGALAALLAIPGAPQRLAGDPWLPPAIAATIGQLPGTGLAALAPRSSQLEVEARVARRPLAAGKVALEVSGALSNPTTHNQGVAAIELRLADADGRTLERRLIRPPDSMVAPGDVTGFSTVALDVPAEATRVFLAVQPGPLGRF